ncbi:MAG: histidine triad nucleotide-binding protein [Cytophagales bacterium]|nr:histidine triad nucleotide-binding protein [Armatimonadota bacterium]
MPDQNNPPDGDTIFARIARKEVPTEVLYEDDLVIAFRDVNPQAPVHALVIPKKPVRNLLALTVEDRELAGAILLGSAEVARRLGVAETGIRVVLNAGSDGGQTVPYLHAHVLGGRPLTWPPG